VLATKDIAYKEFMLHVPSKYILQVYSPFKYKAFFQQAMQRLESIQTGVEADVPQNMVLAMKLLVSWKLYRTIPWCEMMESNFLIEDLEFMNVVLSYYA
jgi:hypothetical protein